jgi:hypothetical protein
MNMDMDMTAEKDTKHPLHIKDLSGLIKLNLGGGAGKKAVEQYIGELSDRIASEMFSHQSPEGYRSCVLVIEATYLLTGKKRPTNIFHVLVECDKSHLICSSGGNYSLGGLQTLENLRMSIFEEIQILVEGYRIQPDRCVPGSVKFENFKLFTNFNRSHTRFDNLLIFSHNYQQWRESNPAPEVDYLL